jgi:hypothetical protein
LHQPCFNLCFDHDRQDFNRRITDNVVEYPNLTNAEPVLRVVKSAKPFYAAAADFTWLVPEMGLKCRSDDRAGIRLEAA